MNSITKFEAYLLTEKRVAHNTFTAYSSDMKQFVLFLKSKSINDIEKVNEKQVKLFLAYLDTLKIKAQSRSRKLSTLKTFYTWAEQALGWKNIILDIVSPKLEKRLPKYLSEKQLDDLLVVAQEDDSSLAERNYAMLCLLYSSGMRISELLNLKIASIHFDTGFVRIEGKGGKERDVPLPKQMQLVLKNYIQQTYKKLFVGKRVINRGQWLFPHAWGGVVQPITRQAFWYMLKNYCKKAGISHDVSPHQLRHSLATHLLKKGAHLRSLQLLLGHEHISTVEIYTHLDKDRLREEYDKYHPRA